MGESSDRTTSGQVEAKDINLYILHKRVEAKDINPYSLYKRVDAKDINLYSLYTRSHKLCTFATTTRKQSCTLEITISAWCNGHVVNAITPANDRQI